MVNTLIVSGPKSCGKKFVVSRLVGECETKESHIEDIKAHSLVLDTRYYTADLNVCLVQQETIAWSSAEQNGSEELKEGKKTEEEKVRPAWVTTEHLAECQALILIFDFHEPGTFLSLSKWENFIEENNPAVMLAVANRKKKPGQPPSLADQKKLDAFFEQCRDWALDNGMEFLDMPFIGEDTATVDTKKEDADVQGLTGLKDKFGIDRIREALEANMWSEMQMKDYKIGARRGSSDHDDIDGDESEGQEDADSKELGVGAEETASATPKVSEERCAHCLKTPEQLEGKKLLWCSRCKRQRYCSSEHQKLHWKTHKLQCKAQETGAAGGDQVHRQPTEDDEEDRDVEADMASFEALFDRMQSIRNNSASMPDADRRAHAERAIKDLLAMEGLNMEDL